jgi:hypothetical protein
MDGQALAIGFFLHGLPRVSPLNTKTARWISNSQDGIPLQECQGRFSGIVAESHAFRLGVKGIQVQQENDAVLRLSFVAVVIISIIIVGVY